jgi:hypothetical protein
MIHKNTARKPWNAIPPPTKETIIELAMTGYSGYNFCHLSDTLYEEHKLKISDETLRLWLRPLGLGKTQRGLKKHRRRRKRREREGELLFLDGSPLAMEQLGVGLLFANSPQARGRAERLNGSFQERLVAELKRHKIKDPKAATKYLNQIFIPKYRNWFGKKPACAQSAWRAVPKELDLKQVLSAKSERVVAKDNTVSFQGRTYQLTPPPGRVHLIQARIQVQEHFDQTIHFVHPKLGEIKARLIESEGKRKYVA